MPRRSRLRPAPRDPVRVAVIPAAVQTRGRSIAGAGQCRHDRYRGPSPCRTTYRDGNVIIRHRTADATPAVLPPIRWATRLPLTSRARTSRITTATDRHIDRPSGKRIDLDRHPTPPAAYAATSVPDRARWAELPSAAGRAADSTVSPTPAPRASPAFPAARTTARNAVRSSRSRSSRRAHSARERARNAPVPSTKRAQRPKASLPAYLAVSGAYSIRCEHATPCYATQLNRHDHGLSSGDVERAQ